MCFFLGELLALGSVDETELYPAMDWLLERQTRIEQALAKLRVRSDSDIADPEHGVSRVFRKAHLAVRVQR